jgi:outer membrane protein assembly factor BamB
MSIERMVFVGLNGRVASLERETGTLLWEWRCPKPRSGYVTMLVEQDRLFVTVNGYTYCLDAFTGEQLWYNPLKGYGTGVASIATVNNSTSQAVITQAAAAAAARAAAAAHGGAAAAGT